MGLRAKLTAKAGRKFTKAWNKLEGGGEVELLKASETENEFEVVETFSSKWFFEYSNFRKNFLLDIAEDETIADVIAEATHLRIDDVVYVIQEGDTTPPKGTDVTWKIYANKNVQRSQYNELI